MTEKNTNLFIVIALIAIAAFSRFFIGLPNFTPVLAIALFGGALIKNKLAYVIPIVAMFITDAYFGFHSTMFAVYGSFLLAIWMGRKFVSKPNAKNVAVTSIASAVQFFIITNFFVWATSGIYTYDFAGLTACYTAAIPFFRNTLTSSMLFSVLMFGSYALANKYSKSTVAIEA